MLIMLGLLKYLRQIWATKIFQSHTFFLALIFENLDALSHEHSHVCSYARECVFTFDKTLKILQLRHACTGLRNKNWETNEPTTTATAGSVPRIQKCSPTQLALVHIMQQEMCDSSAANQCLNELNRFFKNYKRTCFRSTGTSNNYNNFYGI